MQKIPASFAALLIGLVGFGAQTARAIDLQAKAHDTTHTCCPAPAEEGGTCQPGECGCKPECACHENGECTCGETCPCEGSCGCEDGACGDDCACAPDCGCHDGGACTCGDDCTCHEGCHGGCSGGGNGGGCGNGECPPPHEKP